MTISDIAIARLADAAAQRNMDAEELLIALLDEQERVEKQDYEETCAALTEGFAELEAGLGRPLEEYMAESRARWAARRAAGK